MYTEIIKKDNTIIKKGDYFYIQNKNSKILKKINWINEHYFEWLGGYSKIELLQPNNAKSKVKFIFINE
jgi:hypothetical protein